MSNKVATAGELQAMYESTLRQQRELRRQRTTEPMNSAKHGAGVADDPEHNRGGDDPERDGGGDERQPKQADVLISLAKSVKLFHTPDGEEFADIIIGGHRETHRIRGKNFRQHLRHQYYLAMNKGCNSEALQGAVETIASRALFEGEQHEVYCRVAEHDGVIYTDLGDQTWRAIEITEHGWKVIDEPPVRFRRSASTRPLPMPARGDSIELLRPFCNVKSDAEFVLLVAYMLAVLRPDANYPVLVITGEQGTCKSSLVRIIVLLTDPRIPEQRSLPDNADNLITAAKGAHLLAYDNISGMPDWLSDGICRLSTGGGAGKRKLYTDDDEILFAGRRPVIVNGIEDVAVRADLVDRAIMLMLEPIPESKRRQEEEINTDFERAAPKAFGALLDGLVTGLQNRGSIHMPDKPRMADFCLWAEACTRAYWPAGTFLNAYRDSLASSVELVLENSPVGGAARIFMAGRDEWRGTASELLPLLGAVIGEQALKDRTWPKQPNALSNKLRRAAPALRKVGIHVGFGREGHAGPKVITLTARSQPK